jgi:hypothetical protein
MCRLCPRIADVSRWLKLNAWRADQESASYRASGWRSHLGRGIPAEEPVEIQRPQVAGNLEANEPA